MRGLERTVTLLAWVAFLSFSAQAAGNEEKLYKGQAGGRPVTVKLLWHPNGIVEGTLSFHADQIDPASSDSVLVLSGSNTRSGHLELTAAENGTTAASLQLNKWIRDGKIYWGGVCRFNDGLTTDIEVARAIQLEDLRVTASSYSGKVGVSEAHLELLWREDKTVSGRLIVAPPRGGAGEYDVAGDNSQEGRLSLTLSAMGQMFGSVSLTKKVVGQNVHWQGVATFANGQSDVMSVTKSPKQPASPTMSNLDPQG